MVRTSGRLLYNCRAAWWEHAIPVRTVIQGANPWGEIPWKSTRFLVKRFRNWRTQTKVPTKQVQILPRQSILKEKLRSVMAVTKIETALRKKNKVRKIIMSLCCPHEFGMSDNFAECNSDDRDCQQCWEKGIDDRG